MTAEKLIRESNIEYTILEEIEELGRKVWNAAVLACEDAAIRRFEEAVEDGDADGKAFDEAMETVRQLEVV